MKRKTILSIFGYLHEVIRPLVLILPKISSIKTFKDKEGDKNNNDKLVFLCIDDDKLLEK